MATPAEPRGEKKLFLCKFWAVENFKKIAGKNLFAQRERGLKILDTFRIVFQILSCVFQTIFRIDLKIFRAHHTVQMVCAHFEEDGRVVPLVCERAHASVVLSLYAMHMSKQIDIAQSTRSPNGCSNKNL